MKFKPNEIKEHFSSMAAEYLLKKYPDGFELMDIINEDTPDYILMEPFISLYCSEEELKKLYEVLRIENSEQVTVSKNVTDSRNVRASKFVSNCINIYASKVCTDSKDVDGSINVISSRQIFHSDNVLNSTCVYHSINIEDSDIVFQSSNLKNCLMVNRCKNCEKCMLCDGVENMKFAIFNVEVSEALYYALRKPLSHFMRKVQFGDIDNHNVLKYDYNQTLFRKNIDKDFWDWVKSLPNYDPLILFHITGNIDLLRK